MSDLSAILNIIALAYISAGTAQIAALLCLAFGFAVPRTSLLYKIPLGIFMAASALSAISIGTLALTGEETVFSLDALMLLLINAVTQGLMWWMIVVQTILPLVRGEDDKDGEDS